MKSPLGKGLRVSKVYRARKHKLWGSIVIAACILLLGSNGFAQSIGFEVSSFTPPIGLTDTIALGNTGTAILLNSELTPSTVQVVAPLETTCSLLDPDLEAERRKRALANSTFILKAVTNNYDLSRLAVQHSVKAVSAYQVQLAFQEQLKDPKLREYQNNAPYFRAVIETLAQLTHADLRPDAGPTAAQDLSELIYLLLLEYGNHFGQTDSKID